MDEIKAAATGGPDTGPASERSRSVDAADQDSQAEDDVKLYPDASRRQYPKLQDW